jgi:hypothetical protein
MRGQSGVEGCIEQLSQFRLLFLIFEKHSYTRSRQTYKSTEGRPLALKVGENLSSLRKFFPN